MCTGLSLAPRCKALGLLKLDLHLSGGSQACNLVPYVPLVLPTGHRPLGGLRAGSLFEGLQRPCLRPEQDELHVLAPRPNGMEAEPQGVVWGDQVGLAGSQLDSQPASLHLRGARCGGLDIRCGGLHTPWPSPHSQAPAPQR